MSPTFAGSVRAASGSSSTAKLRLRRRPSRRCCAKRRRPARSTIFSIRCRGCTKAMPGCAARWPRPRRAAIASAAARLRLNLERVRLLPAGGDRYVLVNTAAQRLYMYEDGQVVDWMRVVVGKPTQPTPMMAALIRYTASIPIGTSRRPGRRADRAQRGQARPALSEGKGLCRPVRLGRRCDADRSVDRRLESGRGRQGRGSGAAGARARPMRWGR